MEKLVKISLVFMFLSVSTMDQTNKGQQSEKDGFSFSTGKTNDNLTLTVKTLERELSPEDQLLV